MLVLFQSAQEHLEYSQRIMQCIGIGTNKYSVLNIHRINVDAPPSYVIEELLQWNGYSTCWPNYIAKVDRIDNNLGKIRILPFGWEKYPREIKSILEMKLIPLFLLNSLKF